MSISGFMKQINKANQLLSEKIGGAKGTEIDEKFQLMERKTDIISRMVEDVRDRTNEYLQPNPASRAKLWTVNNLSKMRGQVKNTPYPQPEGTLGETMIKYGKDLGDESQFGCGLIDLGESLRQMAGIKYALEDNIKQNFLDPLSQLKENEIREVYALRKKTESRRLDYDCKKRKKSAGTAITEEELSQASEKFEESKTMTEQAMNRLLTNEVDHVTHLLGFAEGLLEYHNQCYEILKDIVKQLNDRKRKLGVGPVNGGNYGGASALKSNGHHHSSNFNNNNNNYGGSLKSNSDTSSAGSRFYDNGGQANGNDRDTTSSMSDNFFPDSRNIVKKKSNSPPNSTMNGKYSSSSHHTHHHHHQTRDNNHHHNHHHSTSSSSHHRKHSSSNPKVATSRSNEDNTSKPIKSSSSSSNHNNHVPPPINQRSSYTLLYFSSGALENSFSLVAFF